MPTPFVCVIDTDGVAGSGGVDYTTLGAWWAALRNGSTLVLGSRDPVVVPGTLAGTIPDNSTVTQVGTGVTARLVHATATQALLTFTSGSQVGGNDTGAWRVDVSNYFTPTGARDLAVVTASCRGTTADTSALDFSKVYSQSNANPLVIRGNLDPTSLVWSTALFRWELGSATGVVSVGGNSENLLLQDLQLHNTNTGPSDLIAALSVANRAAVRAENCIFRGGKHPVALNGGQGRYVLDGCLCYGGSATGAAVANLTSNAPVVVRNCTLIGGAYGLRAGNAASSAAENTYAYGTTAAFSAVPGTTLALNQCASSDGTAAAGTGITATGTPRTAVPADATTFLAPSSADYRLAPGSPLAYAGVDLSPGRTRYFADVSSAAENGTPAGGAPLGVLAFEVGSAVATFRLYNTVSGKWYDGVDQPYDLSLHVPLPSPSTTGDWIALVADTHFGDPFKGLVGPALDALNAGTTGAWNRATDGAWVGGAKPCAGRLKHLMVLGDLGPSDRNDYGTGTATSAEQTAAGRNYHYYQENLWNTSGYTTFPGNGCQSIPPDNTWHYLGNHDTTARMAAASADPLIAAHGGFEAFRLNQHGRSTSAYTGSAYAADDELHQFVDVGNNRFVLLSFHGTAAPGDALASSTNYWNAADSAWAKWAIATLPAGSNLFLLPHAPFGHATRFGHFDQPHTSDLEVVFSTAAWAASFCGHCHGFDGPGLGPTWGSVATRHDFPARSIWDVGASESPPVPPTVSRGPLRGLRAAGRRVRGIRVS